MFDYINVGQGEFYYEPEFRKRVSKLDPNLSVDELESKKKEIRAKIEDEVRVDAVIVKSVRLCDHFNGLAKMSIAKSKVTPGQQERYEAKKRAMANGDKEIFKTEAALLNRDIDNLFDSGKVKAAYWRKTLDKMLINTDALRRKLELLATNHELDFANFIIKDLTRNATQKNDTDLLTTGANLITYFDDIKIKYDAHVLKLKKDADLAKQASNVANASTTDATSTTTI